MVNTVKILKKVALAIFILSLIVSILFLVSNYLSDAGSLPLKLNNTPSQERGDPDQDTAFSAYTGSYVTDPDLGAVTGTSEKNQTVLEFQEWLGKRWVFNENTVEPVDARYDFFVITKVNDGDVYARKDGNQEVTQLSLKCSPENTVLFKSFNMEFVSANFEISREIKSGDMLYTKCTSELCGVVGSECILIRRP